MQQPVPTQTKHITIAVDAMGGDKAPAAIVTGAVSAARALPHLTIALVGDEATIQSEIKSNGVPPPNLIVRHASQVVEMCEAPGVAIRQKRDSSIAVGMRMVRDKQADAMISAGNSGAVMAAATLIVKALPGVDRPAIVTVWPSKRGRVLVLDSGATMDCKPVNLVQFARLGSAYASTVFDRPNPRVGLLSIGEENTKGDELTKEAHQLLLNSPLNFVGNVEPKEVVRGEVDVVVCDGFVGNLMLKTAEGVGELLIALIKDEFSKSWLVRLAALLLRPSLRRVAKVTDYSEHGGALLLGVNGVVVISHGRSNEVAIENAIRVAARAAERSLPELTPAVTSDAPLAGSATR